jgi:hypothetical protein
MRCSMPQDYLWVGANQIVQDMGCELQSASVKSPLLTQYVGQKVRSGHEVLEIGYNHN